MWNLKTLLLFSAIIILYIGISISLPSSSTTTPTAISFGAETQKVVRYIVPVRCITPSSAVCPALPLPRLLFVTARIIAIGTLSLPPVQWLHLHPHASRTNIMRQPMLTHKPLPWRPPQSSSLSWHHLVFPSPLGLLCPPESLIFSCSSFSLALYFSPRLRPFRRDVPHPAISTRVADRQEPEQRSASENVF